MEVCRIEEFQTMNLEFYMEKNAGNLNSNIHVHKYTELIIFTSGRAVHAVENLKNPVESGSVVVIVPGFQHCFLESEDTEYYIFSFDIDRILGTNKELKSLKGIQAFFISSAYYRYRHLFTSAMKIGKKELYFVTYLCEEILQTFQEKQPGYEVAVKEYFFCLMIYLSRRYIPKETGVQKSFRGMEESMTYLETHYTENILVRELATIAHLSERHYTRLFRQIYGQPPMSYIIKCRLDHACDLLKETEYSITEICERCGFSDLASFSKIFKKTYDTTPSRYRKDKKMSV